MGHTPKLQGTDCLYVGKFMCMFPDWLALEVARRDKKEFCKGHTPI